MTVLRGLINQATLQLRRLKGARSGPVAIIRDAELERVSVPLATTRPVWLKLCQSAAHASTMSCVMAMHRSVEMYVARTAGVALTIQQLRDAAVYSVTYDEQTDRHVYEVFAPFGITYRAS